MSSILPIEYYFEKYIHPITKHASQPSLKAGEKYNWQDRQLSELQIYKFIEIAYSIYEKYITFIDNAKINNLDEAVGYFLDMIGNSVGLARAGRSNDDYRRAIRLQIFAISSTCTLDYVLTYIKIFYEPNQCYAFESNAKIIIYANLKDDKFIKEFQKLQKIVAAGVGVELNYVINKRIFYKNKIKTPLITNDKKIIWTNKQVPIIVYKEVQGAGAITKNTRFFIAKITNNQKFILTNNKKYILLKWKSDKLVLNSVNK